MPVPRFVGRMVDDLIVKCPQNEDGCDKTMCRSDVQRHANTECEYAEIGCPDAECLSRIPRRFYGDQCLHYSIECPDCHAKIMALDWRSHLEHECPIRKWPCNHCRAVVVAEDRKTHEKACQEAVVSCVAADSGCHFVGRKAETQTHQEVCPVAMMQPTISALTSRLDQQEALMASLQYRNASIETGLKSMQTLIDTATTLPHMGDGRASRDGQPSTTAAQETGAVDAPFDSATHHLLSLHEGLREEIERVSGSVTELDARSSLMIMNENLRLKEEMSHLNAVVSSMRVQLQWLTSARLQAQQRPSPASAGTAPVVARGLRGNNEGAPGPPIRRLSDSTTKL